jgi:hypothetical protein
MDPQQLQEPEKAPTFKVYPPDQDPLPQDIQEIRNKWVRLGVDINAVARLIRLGEALLKDLYVIPDPTRPNELDLRSNARENYSKRFLGSLSPHMRKLVKRIRNDKRTEQKKEADRKLLVAHCGEWPVGAFEGFVGQIIRKDPLLNRVPLRDPVKTQPGRPDAVVNYLGYLISGLVRKAGLRSNRGPKADQFYRTEICQLLAFYCQLDVITVDRLKDTEKYYNRLPLEKHPKWCPRALIKICLG